MNFDKLPLDDLKAARLEARNICNEYFASWHQTYLDGGITQRDLDSWRTEGERCQNILDKFLGQMIGDRMMWRHLRSRLFEEEKGLGKRQKSLVVALKMPSEWLDDVVKKSRKSTKTKKASGKRATSNALA